MAEQKPNEKCAVVEQKNARCRAKKCEMAEQKLK
jgi:hypothetical protein